MKRVASSERSQGALMSIRPPTADEQKRPNHNVCSREFLSLLDGIDEEGSLEESAGHLPEKKRRLSVDQVKALEKNFEAENKLEPERKAKLAQELGLQPRQVAVWFQNRRARWKTKQLERDYGVLKANYDTLKQDLESLQNDNEDLMKEIRKLKAKLNEENTESNLSAHQEKEALILASESDNPAKKATSSTSGAGAGAGATTTPVASLNAEAMDFKDGPSDSDSSAILNEDNSPNAATTAAFNSSPPGGASTGGFPTHLLIGGGAHQPQFVKMELEDDFFSDEEACNFFSEEQAPTLHWYSPESWT